MRAAMEGTIHFMRLVVWWGACGVGEADFGHSIVTSCANEVIAWGEVIPDSPRTSASSEKAVASRAHSASGNSLNWLAMIPATIASPAPTVLRTGTLGG